MYNNTSDTGRSRLSYLIAEMPDHERPRERLARHGPEHLRDAELLAILLRTGQQGQSVLDLADDVLRTFDGQLPKVARATLSDLQAIPGIGQAKAVELRAAFALANRLSARRDTDAPRLESPTDVAELLRASFRGKQQEEFHVLLLDTKHALLRDECVTVGLVDRSQIHAREVFRTAIRESCSRVILVHNHPSGDPTPSARDIGCTKNLVSSGKIIGIEVLDHVILGKRTDRRPRDFLSMREQNLM